MAYLQLKNISKSFGINEVLKNIDLRVEEGIFCVILGPSGCGKSTLLNIIAGLQEPTGGEVFLNGRNITTLQPQTRDIAMVFQNYALYPHLSVFENMAFGLRLRGLKQDEIIQRLNTVARMLNIEGKLESFPRQLSGGERQRVATGRAIVRDPKLFLFDEPLSNLDAKLRLEVRRELLRLHKELKKTTVYVTHDQTEALSLGDLVVVLRDGHIQQISKPQELYDDPHNLFVAGFIGTQPMNILSVEVQKADDQYVARHGEFCCQIPPHKKAKLIKYLGEQIYLGIRPSDIRIKKHQIPDSRTKDASQMCGEVILQETMGEDQFIYVKLETDLEIKLRIDNTFDVRIGERIYFDFAPDRIYLFDSSGKRI